MEVAEDSPGCPGIGSLPSAFGAACLSPAVAALASAGAFSAGAAVVQDFKYDDGK